MIKPICFILLLFPAYALSEVKRADIIGDWTWLGNSLELTSDYSKLFGNWGSTKHFMEDGTYHYVSRLSGEAKEPVIGSWKLDDGALYVSRPDVETNKCKIISFDNGVLICQDDFIDAYQYMRKQ